MQKQFVFLSGLFLMLSIVLGAMGAHALKDCSMCRSLACDFGHCFSLAVTTHK
jgi:uncharacterized membrane protein YgdD (TMEM256/DUF423 family)